METAAWALQRSVYGALIGDRDVITLLGGAHVYDHVPRGSSFPYIAFGETIERDWSSGDQEAQEHTLTLHVWSHAVGRRQVQSIMAAVRTRLHDQTLALSGYRLVNLRHEFSDVRRQADVETLRGLLRFRAVTEPLA